MNEQEFNRRGLRGMLRGRFVALWVLAGAAGSACSAGGTDENTARIDERIVYLNETLTEYENASTNAQEAATAVGLLTNTSNLVRTSGGVPKSCPDKTQQTFACTAVLSTFDNALCADQPMHAQHSVSPACTAFMIKNEPDSPAVFATAGHCMVNQTECAASSVVLKWRRSPSTPAGNPSIFEQHLYQCTNLLAHGAGSSFGPNDWAVFEVDRHVTGGGVTGGPLTPEREALPLSAVGPVVGGGGMTMGHPVGLPTKIDEVIKMGTVSSRGAGSFYVFADVMEGQSGSPVIDASGEVVGILSEARGPVKVGTCLKQCFKPSEGEPACDPLTGMSANDPNAFEAVAVNISQLPSQFRTTAEHVTILLDQTGSMTTTTVGSRTRWDDAIDAALAWIQLDKLSAGLVERAYSIWTFRDDTLEGGTQTGAKRIWPQANSTDCANFETATGYCVLPRATSLEPPEYAALQKQLESLRESQRAIVGPSTPLAHSLCQSLENLKSIGGLKRIIVESDGGENATALADSCFGNPSAAFGDWSVDLTLRALQDWGMTLDSWQAKVVRRATRFGLPITDAVATPLGSDDFFPFDIVWQVDAHYALEQPSGFARTAARLAPLENLGPAAFAATRAAAPLSNVAALSATGTPTIDTAELSFFRNVGRATPRSSFKTYVQQADQVFGADHVVAGDVNDDGCVGQADLCVMQQNDVWLHRADSPGTQAAKSDLDRDGWVNQSDLNFLTAHWGGGCASPTPLPNMTTAIATCQADYARRWTSFEDPQRVWTVGVGAITLTTTTSAASHLLQSLQVNGCENSTIKSPIFNTRELPAGNKLSVDVRLPVQQQNPFWLGDLQVFVSIPSAGINNVWIGQRLFQGLPLGTFQTLDFTLPAAVKTALAGNRSDAQITLALNTGNCLAPVLIDNVRIRN